MKPTSAHSLGISGDEKDKKGHSKWTFFRTEVVDYEQELLYKDRSPWPSPAPGRPLSEYAEVGNLPDEEWKDWNKNLKWFYIFTVIKKFIPGLWWAYFQSKSRFVDYTDDVFNDHITNGMYSKFLSPLDKGDDDIFRDKIPSVNRDSNEFVKMDFSCIDRLCTRAVPGSFVAGTIVLFSVVRDSNGIPRYQALAIYVYQTDDEHRVIESESNVLAPSDGAAWNLAKYFAVQGAVHRVNMTEHGRLHFPFDSVNAITKSILPTSHPLFRLLIPHLRLSLPVDNSVLEGAYSVLSRVNWVVYSPFAAKGKYTRELIRDGYVGRPKKPNAFPAYRFSTKPHYPETSFGLYLQKNYEVIFKFVKHVIEETLPNSYEANDTSGARRNWELIYLWSEAIAEWVPGFPLREDYLPEDNLPEEKENTENIIKPNREFLIDVVAYIIWDLTIAHAADHIGFGAAGPSKNVFRLRQKPPLKNVKVEESFEGKLVKPWDLFQSFLAHELFYKQHNTVSLVDVVYDFKGFVNEQQLNQHQQVFMKELKVLDAEEQGRDGRLPKLKDVASSIQY